MGIDRQHGAAEALVQPVEGAAEVGALAVHLGEVQQHRDLDLGGELPDLLGVDLDAGDAVDAEQGHVGGAQALLGLGEEDPVARTVDEVDLVLLPGDEAGGETDRYLAFGLLVVEIGQGVAVFDAVQTGRNATGVEQGTHERGLAGVIVAHYSEVSEFLRAINLHRLDLLLGQRSRLGNISRGNRAAGTGLPPKCKKD